MKSLIPIFLVLLLASSEALGQTDSASFDDHIASALQSLVANSSASAESYRFFMDMEQKIELVNLSEEGHQQIYSRIERHVGMFDLQIGRNQAGLPIVAVQHIHRDAQCTSDCIKARQKNANRSQLSL